MPLFDIKPYKETVEPPSGKYTTIVADPPWDYGGANVGGSIRTDKMGRKRKLKGPGDDNHYPRMSIEQIMELPITDLAAKPSHLYLWTTNSFMEEAHQIAKAWKFKVKTILTWGKIKKNTNTPSMKVGSYFLSATEHCLFCVRGSLRTSRDPFRPTLYLSERLPHSVKPPWFYKLVEEQSPGPYLELFARRKRPGWSSWGNQV